MVRSSNKERKGELPDYTEFLDKIHTICENRLNQF